MFPEVIEHDGGFPGNLIADDIGLVNYLRTGRRGVVVEIIGPNLLHLGLLYFYPVFPQNPNANLATGSKSRPCRRAGSASSSLRVKARGGP
jgi:hypothetical protein